MVIHVFDNSNLSQEIFVIETWGAVTCSLGHGRKHMLRILPTMWRPSFKLDIPFDKAALAKKPFPILGQKYGITSQLK